MSIYVDGQEYDGVYSSYGGSLYNSSNPFLIGRVNVLGYSPSYYTHDYNYSHIGIKNYHIMKLIHSYYVIQLVMNQIF